MSSDESQEIDTSPLDGLMADQGFQMFLVEQITADLQEDVITNQPNTTASDMQSQEISYNQMNTTQPAAPGTQHEQPPNQPIDVQPAAPGTQHKQPPNQPIDVQPAAPGTQHEQPPNQPIDVQPAAPGTQHEQPPNQPIDVQPAAPGTQHEQPPNQPIDVQPRPAAPGTQQEQPPIDVQPMPAAPGTQQSSLMYTTGRKRKGYKGETPKAKRSTRSNTLLPNWNKQLDRDNPLL